LKNKLSLKYTFENATSLENFLKNLKRNFKCTILNEEGNILSIEREEKKAKLWISFGLDKNLNLKTIVSIEAPEKFAMELIEIFGKPAGIRKKGPTILDIASMILSIEAKNYNELVEKLAEKNKLSKEVIERILNDIVTLSSRTKTFDQIKQAAKILEKLKPQKQ